MTLSVAPLHAFNVAHYEPLVASSIGYLLERAAAGDGVFGYGCVRNGAPAGVLIATPQSASDFEVSWLYVAKGGRRAGVARALVDAFEQGVAAGPRSFRIAYPTEPEVPEGLEAFFAGRGWTPDAARFTSCALHAKSLASADWLAPWTREPSPEVFPWADLGSVERASLAATIADDPVLADNLSPFRHELGANAETSFGLRRGGEVMGWFLTHTAAPGSLRYSLLGATRALRGSGEVFATVAETLKRQLTIQGDAALGIFAAANGNSAMMRLIATRFAPHVAWTREIASMSKRYE